MFDMRFPLWATSMFPLSAVDTGHVVPLASGELKVCNGYDWEGTPLLVILHPKPPLSSLCCTD
jgi:hypothetical protein